jgi:hypothetical protein
VEEINKLKADKALLIVKKVDKKWKINYKAIPILNLLNKKFNFIN